MSKFDNSIELGPHVASGRLPQPQYNLETLAESREELNVAPVSDAAQTATLSRRMVRGRPRAYSDTLANWRNEKDPVKRRRLRDNLYRRRANRARQAQVDVQNTASTENALETQQAEETMPQASPPTGVISRKGWRNILPAPEKPWRGMLYTQCSDQSRARPD
ncbi:hypothetical protein MBLNU13_g08796t1 [Cladosporium sp. NU13]